MAYDTIPFSPRDDTTPSSSIQCWSGSSSQFHRSGRYTLNKNLFAYSSIQNCKQMLRKQIQNSGLCSMLVVYMRKEASFVQAANKK